MKQRKEATAARVPKEEGRRGSLEQVLVSISVDTHGLQARH